MGTEPERVACNRCGHEWTPRKGGTPKQCVRCKSPYWNRERVQLLYRRPPAARVDGATPYPPLPTLPLPERLAAAAALARRKRDGGGDGAD
jgi:hypothetical protein